MDATRRYSSADARDTFELLSGVLDAEGLAGFDPYDALSSPLLAWLGRSRFVRQSVIQANKRLPVNLRPVLGVPRQRHTKGLALIAGALATRARDERQDARMSRAVGLAEELVDRAVIGPGGPGWGYDFDVQTRWAYYRRGAPNAVVTVFTAHALLDVGTAADRPDFVDVARESAAWARRTWTVRRTDGPFFAYFDGSTTLIHNANLLVAGLLRRVGVDNAQTREAVGVTLAAQAPDGTWPYGEGSGLNWVDGFHTAYVLDDLRRWLAYGPDPEVEVALDRGLDAYLARLVDADGAARATVSSRYPVDIHACATAIGCLARLSDRDPRCLPAARRVLAWTCAEMQRPDGRFAFQRHARWRNSIPYIRWGDAHMLSALAALLHVESASHS